MGTSGARVVRAYVRASANQGPSEIEIGQREYGRGSTEDEDRFRGVVDAFSLQ